VIVAQHINIKFTPYEIGNTLLRGKICKIEEAQERVEEQIKTTAIELNSLMRMKKSSLLEEPKSPEQYQAMPTLDSEPSVAFEEEEEEEEKIAELVIEGTEIKNSEATLLSYHFKVFENCANGEATEVYCSRKTILDRPCWRDDAVGVNPMIGHQVEVYESSSTGLALFDALELPPLVKWKAQFAEST